MAVRRRPTESKRDVPTSPRRDAPTELRLARRSLLLVMLTLPLLMALFGFASQGIKLPEQPLVAREAPRRGAILAADGTVFAEGGVEERHYPQGTLAAHAVGFSGAEQPDGRFGLEGLEFGLDARLQAGEDVVITIDPKLQAVTQAELRRAAQDYEAANGTAVMLEVGTGRVLAAASYPEFDPNRQGTVRNRADIPNRAFLQQVEPGSTLKPFLIAALLEEGRLSPGEMLEVEPTMRVGNRTFSDVMDHEGILNVSDILRFSSNVGMIKLGERFSSQEYHDWLARFGFGQPVGLRYTFSREGQLNPPQDWVPQDHASTSIGQSIATTALQLAVAYSVFANDGLYIPPRIVEDAAWEGTTRVLSPEVARAVCDMMVDVIEKGEARRAKIPGVLVAGKTGTADIFTNGKREAGAYTSSFAGIFPADDPQVVLVVYLQKPQGAHYGSLVAAPIFRAIGSETVALWGTPPRPSRIVDTH